MTLFVVGLTIGFVAGFLFAIWIGYRASKMRVPKPVAAQVLNKMTDELVAKEGQ